MCIRDSIRVVDSRRFHAEDMELLLGELQQMCGYIQARLLGIQEAAEAAEQARSQAQERLNRAEQLQQAYQQLEAVSYTHLLHDVHLTARMPRAFLKIVAFVNLCVGIRESTI